ncbi:MAG: helix-turn-helix domain-containing protein [Cellulosilyticaceae bacterium]
MKAFYTIEDVAEMTMLSTRTIRNYIKQGFLDGEKIEGVWQFTSEDLYKFFDHDFVRQSVDSKKNGIVYDYMSTRKKEVPTVCAVYDYPMNPIEAQTFCNKLLERVNSNEYGEVRFSYQHRKDMSRIIVVGDPKQIARLMED